MQLRRHSNDHVIVVRVEMSTFRDVSTEGRIIVIASEQVVGVVDQTGGVGKGLGEIWRPDTHIGIFCLMDSHVGRPHSICDNSLSEVPLLEEITSVFLMTWMDLGKVDHLLHQFSLAETLIYE